MSGVDKYRKMVMTDQDIFIQPDCWLSGKFSWANTSSDEYYDTGKYYATGSLVPVSRIRVIGDSILCEIPAPGWKVSELDITFDTGYVTVIGTKVDYDDGQKNVSKIVFYMGEVCADSISAKLESGILYISGNVKDPKKKISISE
jgi:HSP20 family molecular chaperone IbpA